jgi:site-specific DNA recombinase
MQVAGIYARVSSDRQKEEHTIDSQIASLVEYAQHEKYVVPDDWIFQDEGYSGSILERPGLERLRDLASEGQIETVLIYSPDRLSRKYAYQVLLTEEFSRYGTDVIFIKSPKATTPEEQLLLQFQGMIAEYERAQIIERTRRGKRHRAKMGSINVLSGAPYGYRYVKKTEYASAYYKIVEKEAEIVKKVYKLYIEEGLSIGAIVRWLNDHGIPTRKRISQWERSTVWGMLRNPAYKGTACFGKTKIVERKKITRPLRQKGGFSSRCTAFQTRPKSDWIEIPVPAIIEDQVFFRAEEKLEENKRYARKRTIVPSLLQGILVCNQCGYAYYRTSTTTSKRKIYYYRCLGSDDYRYTNGRVCQTKPIRQDYLDEIIWKQIIDLLKNPGLIRSEIKRRIQTIQASNPTKQRKEVLYKKIKRTEKTIEKLLDAYQEDLLQLDELRSRMPDLRKREKSLKSEFKSVDSLYTDQQAILKLTENTENFLLKLRKASDMITVTERQKTLRLLVKDILIDDDTIRIRHSIPSTKVNSPVPIGPGGGAEIPSCLLRSRSHNPTLGCSLHHLS